MSSIRKLKKQINFKLSDVIEEVYVWQLLNDAKEKGEKIIDEVIETFDDLIHKANVGRFVEDRKKHFKEITQELENKVDELLKKLK